MSDVTAVKEALDNVAEFEFETGSVWGLDVVLDAARSYVRMISEMRTAYCQEHNCGIDPGDPIQDHCPMYSWERAYRPNPVVCDIVVALVVPLSATDSEEANDG